MAKNLPHLEPYPKGSRRDLIAGLRITHFARHSIGLPRQAYRPRRFGFFSLCHLYDGNGWFSRDGNPRVPITPDQGVLSCPDDIVDYAGDGQPWIEDYICFIGPIAEHLRDSGILKTGILDIGRSRRLLPIIQTALDPSRDAQLKANTMLQTLLVDLYLEQKQLRSTSNTERFEKLQTLLAEDLEKTWTVKAMAQFCNLSINHFRQQFRQHTGMNPKLYAEQLKMKHAAEKLCHNTDPIGHVAAQYGYADPYHFSRSFKRIMGMSPRHYRQAYRQV